MPLHRCVCSKASAGGFHEELAHVNRSATHHLDTFHLEVSPRNIKNAINVFLKNRVISVHNTSVYLREYRRPKVA
jgi:hypothetical protein